MTSSSAISYPSFKGLDFSNSSFVQVSHPVRDSNNRNSPLNHRHSVSKSERGSSRSKHSKPNDFSARSEDFASIRQKECLTVKDIGGDNETQHNLLNTDTKLKLKVEKSQQYDIRESGVTQDDHIRSTYQEVDLQCLQMCHKTFFFVSHPFQNKTADEINDLSLTKPESVHNLIKKHPKHTIIINNTFINRPPTEQDEFLAKFSPNFYAQNPNISIRDGLPSVAESICLNESNSQSDEHKAHTDSVNENFVVEKSSVPIGSIVVAVLWIILILFWFLLYLKVLTVYRPSPKVIPQSEPSNFEWCLMYLKKIGMIVRNLWKF